MRRNRSVGEGAMRVTVVGAALIIAAVLLVLIVIHGLIPGADSDQQDDQRQFPGS